MPTPELVNLRPGKVIATSSYEDGEGNPEHAVDGDEETFWHSRWSSNEARHPHFLVIDYGQPVDIAGVNYIARRGNENGHVRSYEIYLSDDATRWNEPAAKGSISSRADQQAIRLSAPVRARYLKFVILSEQRGRPFASVAELELIEAGSKSAN